MVSIYPGNRRSILSLLLLIFVPATIVSGQNFTDLPPLLYNQLDPLSQNQDTNVELINSQHEKKSLGTAFLLSLMLPGLGEA